MVDATSRSSPEGDAQPGLDFGLPGLVGNFHRELLPGIASVPVNTTLDGAKPPALVVESVEPESGSPSFSKRLAR